MREQFLKLLAPFNSSAMWADCPAASLKLLAPFKTSRHLCSSRSWTFIVFSDCCGLVTCSRDLCSISDIMREQFLKLLAPFNSSAMWADCPANSEIGIMLLSIQCLLDECNLRLVVVLLRVSWEVESRNCWWVILLLIWHTLLVIPDNTISLHHVTSTKKFKLYVGNNYHNLMM